MKAKFKGKVVSTKRNNDFVELSIEMPGVVVETKMPPAKEAKLQGSFFLKPVIADEIKIGSIITITVSDEEDA